jgi:lysophospholipase L1-like esterase
LRARSFAECLSGAPLKRPAYHTIPVGKLQVRAARRPTSPVHLGGLSFCNGIRGPGYGVADPRVAEHSVTASICLVSAGRRMPFSIPTGTIASMPRRVWTLSLAIGLIGAVILLWHDEWLGLSQQIKEYREVEAPLRSPRKLLEHLKANQGPIDILLLGDSITQYWGGSPLDSGTMNAEWKKRLGTYKTINAGVGGDRIAHVIRLLDHRVIAGMEPRLVILMIGVNDLLFTPEADTEGVAHGIGKCVAKIRVTFPNADVIVAKILPAQWARRVLDKDVKKTNAAMDRLKLDSDQKVHVLDLTCDFAEADGRLKKPLYTDMVHLSLAGYSIYAERLKPLVDSLLGGKGVGGKVSLPPFD